MTKHESKIEAKPAALSVGTTWKRPGMLYDKA